MTECAIGEWCWVFVLFGVLFGGVLTAIGCWLAN